MFQFYGYYHFVFWDVAHSPTLIISVNRVSYTELLIRAIGSCLIHPASGHCVPEQGFVTVGEGMSQSVWWSARTQCEAQECPFLTHFFGLAAFRRCFQSPMHVVINHMFFFQQ